MLDKKILVFSGGEIHDHKGCGDKIAESLAEDRGLQITRVEEDLSIFASPELEQFDAIAFYYTIGTITAEQYMGLSAFVSQGKGFVPVHSGADSFQHCDEYRAMVGGHFVNHPHYRTYQVSVLDREHEIMSGLDEFQVTDEQYITSYDPRVNVLATALWQGKAWPVAWTRSWGKGRVFYLALGHDPAACSGEYFKLLLNRGARWAAG